MQTEIIIIELVGECKQVDKELGKCMNELSQKTNNALKWSSITELLARLISPIINMILARILAPEAFGVLATITMVLSFAEIFVESGFQKFLIQHEFDSEEQERRYMTVAFWSNIIFAMLIWGVIAAFCESIAAWVGNDGLGRPLAVAGVAVPLYGVIGIQNCQLKKRLDFKKLFYVRIFSAFIPLFVTLPLALLGLDYWALIIGNTAGLLIQSVLLVSFGKFIPKLYFNWYILKDMLKIGVWTLLDGCVTWITAWVDSLLISKYMTEYYLGIYKNSVSTVNTLFAIITSALTPVLFSSLSKLQDNKKEFNETFLSIQKMLCLFLLPLAFGVFIYRDFATLVLFGNQWGEAADVIGWMSLSIAFRTIFVRLYSDAYRAKGHFALPLILQILDIAILIPACLGSVKNGFDSMVLTRALVNLDLIIPEIIVAWVVLGISLRDTVSRMYTSFIATFIMTCAGCIMKMIGSGVAWTMVSIVLCVIIYFGVLFVFRRERDMLLEPVLIKIRTLRKR